MANTDGDAYNESRIFSCILLILNMALCSGIRALRVHIGVVIFVCWVSSSSMSEGMATVPCPSCFLLDAGYLTRS